jgi:hypothetical protein
MKAGRGKTAKGFAAAIVLILPGDLIERDYHESGLEL